MLDSYEVLVPVALPLQCQISFLCFHMQDYTVVAIILCCSALQYQGVNLTFFLQHYLGMAGTLCQTLDYPAAYKP
jgi:hypothetical protein